MLKREFNKIIALIDEAKLHFADDEDNEGYSKGMSCLNRALMKIIYLRDTIG